MRNHRVGIALLGAGILLLAASVPSQAADPPACPSQHVPATTFTDTVGSSHRAAIDCAVWWGLTQGRTTTSFAPARAVTRGQVAAMLARQLLVSGVLPDDPPAAGFEDTVGHLFAAEIDALAALDIVAGRTPTRFEPDAPVTRAQFASLLSRTFERGFDLPLPDGPVRFVDVPPGSTHEEEIGQLVAAGITTGRTTTTFDPGGTVSRAQLASFLARAMTPLLAAGRVELPAARPGPDDPYASRLRAAWVHLFDDTLKTRAGIERVVDELVAADATAVIAQVARRHDAYYDSAVLPRTTDPQLTAGLDVLEELVSVAHARGLEVHAWVGVAPAWHPVYAGLPVPDGWLWTEHGRDAPVDQRWVTRTHDGAWSDYLDPGVPAVREHVAEVVEELVTRYPIDGIHLDYVRYSSAAHGYNPIALDRYRQDTGATGTPSPDDPGWSAWRRVQTRAVVRAARDAIERADREVALSAAVITWGDAPSSPDRAGFRATLPYTRTLQDWDGWVRAGELDLVLPMNYYRDHDAVQARQFDGWQRYQRALAREAATAVVPGPGGYLNHPGAVWSQVRASMVADGASIYSFQQPTLDGSRDIWRRLAATRWGYPPARG
jgi:uncharacterized lipoprotein YddW (UPF0748 family)